MAAFDQGCGNAGQEERRPKAELETTIRKALEADPKFADAYGALAAVLGSPGQFEAAEAAARQAVKLTPDRAGSHEVLGFALMFQGHFADAEAELREAMRLNPDDAGMPTSLGECAQEQGKLDEAIVFWNQAKLLDPTEAGIHSHLGDAYAKKAKKLGAKVLDLSEAPGVGKFAMMRDTEGNPISVWEPAASYRPKK